MTGKLSKMAGKVANDQMLVDVPKLITAYYTDEPDPSIPSQRVIFGTSGHRGSSLEKSFNESHILSISQAICLYRRQQKVNGPLFLGIDTHALSIPALRTALEVLAANEVEVMIALNDEYTPTPVISHAILTYNNGRTSGLADGIVITPSHNPPHSGGFKYNPPHGGPADNDVTKWLENKSNEFLQKKLLDVKRVPYEKALKANSTHRYDYLTQYVNDLEHVIDFKVIQNEKLHLGVDPLGGAGIHYWPRIADRYKLDLTVTNDSIDPTFRFMTVDWDGQIRMDPSSPYAMKRLSKLKNQFDIAFACDTDHDRHGIVTPSKGLMPPNHFLCVAIDYLFKHRPDWKHSSAIGKTIVSSQMIDRIAKKLHRKIYEVPVGFKWFVEGLLDSSLGFCGEESAGASFLRKNGTVWTTDKDGIVPALLAAEIVARSKRDLSDTYQDFEREFGASVYERTEAPLTLEQKKRLASLSPEKIKYTDIAGEKIKTVLTNAEGNGTSIGGVKIVTENGWFMARPSGTENLYKIYAESFSGSKHLKQLLKEAQAIVNDAID